LPEGTFNKLQFLLVQFLNPWIMTGLASAFLASLAWMAVMTRLALNYAYPLMSLAFLIAMAFSALFLNEALSPQRIVGTLLVVSGLVSMTRRASRHVPVDQPESILFALCPPTWLAGRHGNKPIQ